MIKFALIEKIWQGLIQKIYNVAQHSKIKNPDDRMTSIAAV